MKATRQAKNFFFFGWGLGAVGYLGYKYTTQTKEPTRITPQHLQNSALANETSQLHYQFKDRKTHLKEVEKYTTESPSKDEYDMIVIGGGCNGSGVFLEGASRGLKCLMLEADDFAAGTSSKSTKLIHGGIRYLEQVFEFSLAGNRREKFDLVKEALKERSYFVENGFYMNRNVPIVIPSTSLFWTLYYYAGTVVYHYIYLWYADKDCSYKFKFPVIFGQNQLQSHFPLLDEKYKYGVVYQDGQFNDTRMTIDLLLTGTIDNYIPNMKGGNLLNYAKVVGLLKNPETKEIEGVEFEDTLTGKTYKVKSKSVCSCTGTFGDQIRKMDNPESGQRILSVGGSHMILPNKFGNKKYGLLLPKTSDGRILFCLPWEKNQVVGTTEVTFDQPELNPKVSFDEMLMMVKEISNIYPKVEPSEISNSIKSKWCGLRPLILEKPVKQGEKIDTKALARTHVIERSPFNLFSLMGGKWSTYRSMAEETVDQICEHLKNDKNVDFSDKNETTQTKHLRLSGEFVKDQDFNYPQRREYTRYFSRILLDQYDYMDKVQAKYLIKTYGDKAFDIMKLCKENPALREQIHGDHPFIKAEIIYHIRSEMAVKPMDVIFRRTRLGFIDRNAIQDSLPGIIELFGNEFGWDKKQRQQQLEQSQQTILAYEY